MLEPNSEHDMPHPLLLGTILTHTMRHYLLNPTRWLRPFQGFYALTTADFIVRSAYQMGKTPLLPIFAATLGASGVLLGLIVSVSTLTGMVLKPVVGWLSDRSSRRLWLFIGTGFFTLMPFAYWLIYTPTQLFWLRIIHGTSTAIYGPVTLAYIAEHSKRSVAESMSWFELARKGGYIVGPALAGWLLLYISPAMVFSIIGLLSALAFVPIAALPEVTRQPSDSNTVSSKGFGQFWQLLRRSPAIWGVGGLEASHYVVAYAIKAFLPVYALAAGVNVALVGLFFSLLDAVDALLRPFAGRFGDRWGYSPMIALGMALFAAGVWWLAGLEASHSMMAVALLLGVGQALVFSSTLPLVVANVDEDNIGTRIGLVGTWQNGGKVVGPVLGGLLMQHWGYQGSLQLLSGMMALLALFLWQRAYVLSKP